MPHYDTILIGATALALGYAHRAEAEGRHCAVIEAGCICMPEFSAAWSGEAYMPQHRYSDETGHMFGKWGVFAGRNSPLTRRWARWLPNGLTIPDVTY